MISAVRPVPLRSSAERDHDLFDEAALNGSEKRFRPGRLKQCRAGRIAIWVERRSRHRDIWRLATSARRRYVVRTGQR